MPSMESICDCGHEYGIHTDGTQGPCVYGDSVRVTGGCTPYRTQSSLTRRARSGMTKNWTWGTLETVYGCTHCPWRSAVLPRKEAFKQARRHQQECEARKPAEKDAEGALWDA